MSFRRLNLLLAVEDEIAMRKPRTDEELDTSVETVESMVIDFRQLLADTFRRPVDDIAAPSLTTICLRYCLGRESFHCSKTEQILMH